MHRVLVTLLILGLCLNVLAQQQVSLREIEKEVSFSFEATNDFILLNVRFNNVLPLKFIFDTGSEHTILFKKDFSDLLGIEYQKRIPLLGSDLSQQIYGYIARGIYLNLDNTCVARSDILVLEEDYLGLDEFTGVNIDGIIGANVFRHFIVHINNKQGKINLIRPDHFKPPRRYDQIKIDVYKNKPYIEAFAKTGALNITLRLLLDTGAALPLLLYTNTHPDLLLPETTITGNLGMGLGGFLEGYIGRVEEFKFGDFEYNSLIASFQELNMDSLFDINLNKNGIIGNSLLKRFNYYIDYNHEILYIKANRKYRKRFQYDKSGLVIAATGYNLRNYIVQKVLPGSPAEQAGLQKGDVIKKIQRIPSTFYTLSGINSVLSSRKGKKIHLTISREGDRMKIKFKLRDLI